MLLLLLQEEEEEEEEEDELSDPVEFHSQRCYVTAVCVGKPHSFRCGDDVVFQKKNGWKCSQKLRLI
ncbi:Hypothetical predicted protein [Xyrichtys novacula]|uniref:Uncharacterized protein n=1 Tax=Xyrichtys novacula TaxID=13765 RepID=A0AAV1FTT2_XYRNO|nr:Hypothetical predicted protein [Xyrichtys novacula]